MPSNNVILCDRRTNEWFRQHPDARTTVTQCDKCGLWYKPSLGHDCVHDGVQLKQEEVM